MRARLDDHAVLCLLVVVSRIGLSLAGFRLYFSHDWLFFADPADLRERLGTTLLFFHLYPPGMNLLAALVAKLGGAAGLGTVLFAAGGLVLANSLLYLLRSLGVSRLARMAAALAFALIPSTLFFERSFTDTYPTAVLLTLAVALLHRACERPAVSRWAAFFWASALLALFRSSFHLVWFVLLLGLTLHFSRRRTKVLVMKAALAPLLVISALYLKNLSLFGFFGPGSHVSFAYHAMTNRIAGAEKAAWVADGKLTPLALLPVYAPPSAYEPTFVAPPSSLPSILTSLERPSSGLPNFNHRFLLDAGRIRRADALAAVEQRPRTYVRLVAATVLTFFAPSTRYHPHDSGAESPHFEHRKTLGGYESFYDAVVHGVPFRPVGVYLFLPFALGWALTRARTLLREGDERAQPEAAVLAFGSLQIVYVVLASTWLISTESARYRYAVEPLIWLLAVLSVGAAARAVRARLSARLTATSKARTVDGS